MNARHHHIAGLIGRLPKGDKRHVFSGIGALVGALGATETGAAIAGIAGAIGTTASTALTGAALGATTGAVTGGNVGKDALFGGLAGGVAGAGASALGYSSADMAGALGMSPTTAASSAADVSPAAVASALNTTVDSDGIIQSGPFVGMPASDPEVVAAATGSSASQASSLANVSNVLNSGAAAANSGNAGSALAGATGATGKGIGNTALALGALSALGSAINKPKQATAPTVQTPPNTSPLQTTGLNATALPGRSFNPSYGASQPDFETAAMNGQLPTYWTGNYGMGNYAGTVGTTGAAQGGAMRSRQPGALNMAHGSQEFSTDHGDSYVKGPGDGTSDNVPAQLSDGEMVLTAHEVALVGNGSNDAGARKINNWRHWLVKEGGKHRYLPPQFGDGALNKLARSVGGKT